MQKIKLFKVFLTVIILVFLGNNMSAQCDDFETMDEGSYRLTPVTTPLGWTAYYANIGKDIKYDEGVGLVKRDNPSYITSPVFINGCRSINFKYREVIETPLDMKVEIKQEGIVVWDSTVTNILMGYGYDWREFSIDNLNIDGAFQLVINNVGNPNAPWDMSELLVKDICITSAPAPQCDHSDDFASLPSDIYTSSVTTSNGWKLQGTNNIVDNDGSIILDAQLGNNGSVTSPVFNDGCSTIKFQYTNYDPSYVVKLKIEIKKAGESVWTQTTTPAPDDWAELSYDLNISGEFQLTITVEPDKASDYPLIGIKDICLTAPPVPIPAHNYTINVPKDATVFVGDKDQTVTVAGNYLTKHYIPFTPKPEVHIAETDTSRIWYYDLPAPKNSSGGFSYRINRPGGIEQVGLFLPRKVDPGRDTSRVFTDAQLSLYNSKEIDHDVNHLEGRNVADVFLNINAQGHLTLPLRADTTFQLIHTRNWQAIDTDVNNYFIEPSFHYTVIDESGQPGSNVISISDSGLIRPLSAGRAIVLVDYDAMLCYHTGNVVPYGTDVKTNPALFSKLWPENTGVFVVSVEQPEPNISTNMNLNAYWAQDGTDKTDSIAIDAELDVMYFEAAKGSFPYTFKPEGVTSVEVATPVVGEHSTSYAGFAADSVTVDSDGSYTVRLGFGRNIVKLLSATGATYQVITAKPVTYAVSNLTHPDEPFQPGDEVSALFNTLYHPSNKMSGIYNMTAGIQYTGFETNFPLILGPGQYTFASRAQQYKITIPADYTGKEFALTNGVIKVRGFGSNYGAHREITIQNGVNPNLNASVREAYFGSLPEIRVKIGSGTGLPAIDGSRINVYPNPFVDYVIIEAPASGKAVIYDLSGKTVLSVDVSAGSNRINTSALSKGVYVLKIDGNSVKIVK
jgi:hypothetical protein